jgi:tetratricopeptide (TPR) repeat protein
VSNESEVKAQGPTDDAEEALEMSQVDDDDERTVLVQPPEGLLEAIRKPNEASEENSDDERTRQREQETGPSAMFAPGSGSTSDELPMVTNEKDGLVGALIADETSAPSVRPVSSRRIAPASAPAPSARRPGPPPPPLRKPPTPPPVPVRAMTVAEAAEAEAAEAEVSSEVAAEVTSTHESDFGATEVTPAPSVRERAPVKPAPTFADEQDATAHLVRSQQRDAWAARAVWLRAEAEAIEDKAARSRALIAVSEIYAMAGEEQIARTIAAEARELSPSSPLAHRQLRGLLARDGDWQGALEVLDTEGRTAPTPASRCHAAVFGADIARVRLGDEEGTHKRLDEAQRAQPSDPRAHVQRLCEALGTAESGPGAAFTKVRPPDARELSVLRDAFAQVAVHRGVVPKGSLDAISAYDALLRARAAIESGDVAGTVASLGRLQGEASLKGGAGWLAGMLAAARKDTRAQSIEAFRGALDGTHDADARRALAARAIELGDAAAARAAIEGSDSIAFSAADRISLAALTGGPSDALATSAEAAASDEDLSALLAAASAALREPGQGSANLFGVGGDRARAAASLGRALGNVTAGDSPLSKDDALTSAVLGHTEHSSDSGTSRALSLELDLDAKAGAKVARAVASWHGEATDGDRDGALAGALLAEIAGDTDFGVEGYDRARQADPAHEGATRARAAHADAQLASMVLSAHAQSIVPGTRAAVLFSEAAIRLLEVEVPDTSIEDERDRLLRGAAEIDPRLPLSIHLGERTARSRGDRDGLIEWLHMRRQATEDPIEQARDFVREALISPEGAAHAAGLLAQALRARPNDIGLRELYERLSPERPEDRAVWRAERAAVATGIDAARLWLEAALEHERDGKLDLAASAARQAMAAGETQLAPLCAYRCALAGHGTGDLIDVLLARAKESTDPAERLEFYERLADLDEQGRGDAASGLLWRRTILDETPTHLPTLRRVASALIAAGRDEELEPVALTLARTLEGPEAIAHAMLSARLRLRIHGWDETREPVELAYRQQPRALWALRQMAAHARAQGQQALAVECDVELATRTDRASEVATISLRAAESAVAAGDIQKARELLERAIELAPHHLVVHLENARLRETLGDAASAATALEAAAQASITAEERVRNLYSAAVLWAERVVDNDRARGAFENVFALDPSYQDVFQRLQAIYVTVGARAELAALLERRLEAVTDPAERVEMEVLRGRALADVGDAAAAKQALAAALDQNPDHVEALMAFADVAAAEEDWAGAEQAWIRLARLIAEPERQAELYMRLGDLYNQRLPNAERAELAYQEVLKRFPSDERARERLVELYKGLGDTARALEQQTILINAVEEPEAKCRRTTQLADIYEAMGDTKKAEQTLLQARKSWPKDDVALGALAAFYQRTDQAQAANVLLDRAVADARRALGTGRFEPYLFSTVATVAELRGRPEAARIARASVSALDGVAVELSGAGAAAGDRSLDDLLAPDVMSPAFRELLQRTGPLLDTAVSFDLTTIRATPLPPQVAHVAEQIKALAESYGLSDLKVYQSSALGSVCVAAGSHPASIVLGQALVASSNDAVRNFLVHRALKVVQTNASAFSRTAPIDLWPLLAAYLKALSPAWTPQGVDPAKLNDAFGRISKAMEGPVDADVATLAADVIGNIGNRASTLNTAVNGWGARAGLLAVGDPNIALTGIAWAGGHANAPPAAGKERVTWIGRNAEARELIVFSVSDAYADARSRLGLD